MKILFAGEGGQGVQTAAEILAKAAFNEGQMASYIPNFGVEQRGGASLAFVVIDPKPVVYPKFQKADLLVVFSDRSVDRVRRYQSPQTKVIKGPAMKDGLKTKFPARVWNIFLLGEVNRQGMIVKKESLVKAMNERFEKHFRQNPELKKLDLRALTNE